MLRISSDAPRPPPTHSSSRERSSSAPHAWSAALPPYASPLCSAKPYAPFSTHGNELLEEAHHQASLPQPVKQKPHVGHLLLQGSFCLDDSAHDVFVHQLLEAMPPQVALEQGLRRKPLDCQPLWLAPWPSQDTSQARSLCLPSGTPGGQAADRKLQLPLLETTQPDNCRHWPPHRPGRSPNP